jgi:hypothetical protein
MRGFKGRTARAACIAALVALTGASPAFATVELDQNAIVVDTGGNVFDAAAMFFGTSQSPATPRVTNMLVQSVTAGKTGFLDHIDVQLGKRVDPHNFPLAGSVTFRLYDGDLTAGSANLIASQVMSGNDLPLRIGVTTDFADFDVRGANFLVTEGQTFSFSFDFMTPPDAQFSEVIDAIIGLGRMIDGKPVADFNDYAGGQLNVVNSSIGGLGSKIPGDVGFRSFVDVQAGAVPEPASWALMIGGFALAGGALRRRAHGHRAGTLRFA